MRFPAEHCHFTRIVFKSNRIAGNDIFYYPDNDVRLILFVWENMIRQISMDTSASRTLKSFDWNMCCHTPFRSYNS